MTTVKTEIELVMGTWRLWAFLLDYVILWGDYENKADAERDSAISTESFIQTLEESC